MNIFRKTVKNILENFQAKKDLKIADGILKDYLLEVKGKKILIITHGVGRSGGAFIILNKFINKLIKNGWEPLVISYNAGEYIFKEQGFKIIYGKVFQFNYAALKKIAINFEKIFVNSVVCNTASDQFPKAIWFIQEGKNVEDDFMNYLPNLKRSLNRASKIFVVSDYAKQTIEKYNENCEVINLGVEEPTNLIVSSRKNTEKIKFILVGALSECKAQDVLTKAILKLDKNYIQQSDFYFLTFWVGHRYRNMKKTFKFFKNVHFINWLEDQDKKWQLFSDIDVFIIPSRDESCSLVTLEACMLSKPVIVSENVGAKYMVKNNENGYIVKTGDENSLKEAIQKIIDNKENLEKMGNVSRNMYEKYANSEILEKSVSRLVDYLENREED